MQCPRCQAQNREGARFCRECGSPFAVMCPSCGAQLEPGSRFCDGCGAKLAPNSTPAAPVGGSAVAPTLGSAGVAPARARFAAPETYIPKHLVEKILTSKASLEGERKQVTVLFADLKGSMELLAERDSGRGTQDPRPGARVHDGSGAPLRRHREPGDGRRGHGALRRPARARRSCGTGVLCGTAYARDREALCRRDVSHARHPAADPGGAQLRRGGGAHDRQRLAHGLHGSRTDDALGGAYPPGRSRNLDSRAMRRSGCATPVTRSTITGL